MNHFSTTLASRPDAERVRLRLGTAFIEHIDCLWPEGEPEATPEMIRANVDTIVGVLEEMFLIDQQGRPHRYIPQRLLWLPPLLASINTGAGD